MLRARSGRIATIALILLRSGAALVLPASLSARAPMIDQGIAADPRIAFDIPAEPLDTALAQYFRVTGVQLLYDAHLTAGRRSSAVRGNYAPREALALLLRGTGLIARYSRASAAVITTPEDVGTLPLVPLGRVVVREKITMTRLTAVDRMAYYGQLESELQAYLRTGARAPRLRATVRLTIRVSESGKITEVRSDRASRDGQMDALVSRTLLGRTVSAPPPGMVQPLLIALHGRGPGKD